MEENLILPDDPLDFELLSIDNINTEKLSLEDVCLLIIGKPSKVKSPLKIRFIKPVFIVFIEVKFFDCVSQLYAAGKNSGEDIFRNPFRVTKRDRIVQVDFNRLFSELRISSNSEYVQLSSIKIWHYPYSFKVK